MQSDKTIWIDHDAVSPSDLEAKLKELGERSSNKDILVKADRALTYGDVKIVMGSIDDGGLERVGSVTEE